MADNRNQDNLDEQTRSKIGQMGGEARKSQDADYSQIGQKGGRSQGQENNPGNFANREDVEDVARKGGQS
jgi:general stress protein YciG